MKLEDFGRIMDMLDRVVTDIDGMHAEVKQFGTGVPLFRSEIHTIQAIGKNPGINITRLAEALDVTKGAVSQVISKLVKKGLVIKKISEDNMKEVKLDLTEKGWIGFNSHEQFHNNMFKVVNEYYGDVVDEKMSLLETVLEDMQAIMKRFMNIN